MNSKKHRTGFVLTLVLTLLAGCEANPGGPRAPSLRTLKTSSEGQSAPGKTERQPVTKNPREIVNPE